jgi:hypothetical protein
MLDMNTGYNVHIGSTTEKHIYYRCHSGNPTLEGLSMKKKMKINETAKVLYVPTEMIEDGYKGDIDALMNARTVTLIHPTASLEEVRRSLEIVLQDVILRIDSQKAQEKRDEKEAEKDEMKEK